MLILVEVEKEKENLEKLVIVQLSRHFSRRILIMVYKPKKHYGSFKLLSAIVHRNFSRRLLLLYTRSSQE